MILACEQVITLEGAIGIGVLVVLSILLGYVLGKRDAVVDELEDMQTPDAAGWDSRGKGGEY